MGTRAWNVGSAGASWPMICARLRKRRPPRRPNPLDPIPLGKAEGSQSDLLHYVNSFAAQTNTRACLQTPGTAAGIFVNLYRALPALKTPESGTSLAYSGL